MPLRGIGRRAPRCADAQHVVVPTSTHRGRPGSALRSGTGPTLCWKLAVTRGTVFQTPGMGTGTSSSMWTGQNAGFAGEESPLRSRRRRYSRPQIGRLENGTSWYLLVDSQQHGSSASGLRGTLRWPLRAVTETHTSSRSGSQRSEATERSARASTGECPAIRRRTGPAKPCPLPVARTPRPSRKRGRRSRSRRD